MSLSTAQIIKRYKEEFSLFAAKCLKVRNHNTSKIELFKFRPGQKVMDAVAKKMLKEFGYIRALLLKNRRFGGSTYIGGRGYHIASLNFNKNVFIIGHETDSTNTLFKMVQLFHEKNPIPPSTKTSNAQELIFDIPEGPSRGKGLKSEYKLATAKNVEAGRSQGIHFLHGCLHKDTQIVLSNGQAVSVEDIEAGDIVITGSGKQAKVRKKFNTGQQQTYLLRTWLSNESIAITGSHKVFTDSGVKKCKDLEGRDFILVPKIEITNSIQQYEFNLKNIERKNGGKKHVEHAVINLDYDFGYYLGYYLAEGCVKRQWKKDLSGNNKPCAVHFAYHKDEKFIEKAKVFARKYCTSFKSYSDETSELRRRTYFYGAFLSCLTDSICGSQLEKHIPGWFFRTNKTFLAGVVEGYVNGDGSKGEERRINIVSVHEKIARQIKRLIIALGYGVPSLRYRKNRFRYGIKTKPVFIVDLTGDTFLGYCGRKRSKLHKATKYKIIDGKFYVKLKSLKKFEKSWTYDIEVDHPDHSFETPVGVVSNSEEAYWPGHASDLLTSLMSSVPRPPMHSEVWRESTGNGYGNSFQKAVFEAYREGQEPYFTAKIKDFAPHMPDADIEFTFAYKDPESDWVLIFVPWFLDPSCLMKFKNEDEKKEFVKRIHNAKDNEEDINHDALRIQKKYCLTLEQLYWREWEIKNTCKGDVVFFKQENPLTVIEAFRTKGSNHYPAEFCDMVEQGCIKPIAVGSIVYRDGLPVIRPNPRGEFKIWERYDPKDEYFLSVDVAGGKREIHIKENKDPDRTNIDVYNLRTGDQVAQWNGHRDYDLVHELVVAIGAMYGPQTNATACVELNNHGFSVVGNLKKIDYPMYYHKPGEYGWITNPRTKPVMADGLLTGCRDGTITIRCKETVEEMRYYIEINGRYGAESGEKDDRVTTAQMAVQMLSGGIRSNRRKKDEDAEADNGLSDNPNSWMAM